MVNKEKRSNFIDKFFSSASIIKDGLLALKKYPVMILPIIISWIFYAATIIYFMYYFNWSELTKNQIFLLIFLIITFFCTILSIASFMLLEFIEQIESGKKPNFFVSLSDTITKDFIKALPIILVWSVICFILLMIKAMTAKEKKKQGIRKKPTMEDFAKTLAGYKEFSLSSLTIDIVNDSIRIIIFTIFPAIAWENETPVNAIKKGFCAIKNNISVFVSGFIQTEIIATVIFIPVGIVFVVSDHLQKELPHEVWLILIVYICLCTSLYLYLQQIYTAMIYLWNMKWLKAVQEAKIEDKEIPTIYDIKKPELLDDVAEFRNY